jgi:D-alanyl-D-alanine carboxypeptidase/D-alanyl-D-alanine-endopeptidase (penicillin-binding protein 4)
MRARAAIVFLLTFLLVFFAACHYNSTVQQTGQQTSPPAPDGQVELPAGNIQLPPQLEISTQPKDIALAQKINGLIDNSEFSNARWGVIVLSLKDGRVLAAREAQKLFSPASTLKLITTAAALDKLGAEFRWKTSAYANENISGDGKLAGSLILYGRGAPDLSSEKLSQLADTLKSKGLRQIEGDVAGDGSYFSGEGLGDGWLWADAQWYYGAEAAALTFNDNQIDIEVSAESAKAEGDQINIENNLKPLTGDKVEAVGINREFGSNTVYVWGDKQAGSAQKARIAVPNSALWAAQELKEELEKRGITVKGSARAVDWRSKDKLDENKAVELAGVESKTLAEVVRKTNKDSVNLYAELMLRTLGKKFGAEAPDEDAQVNALRGDDQAGTAVIRKWLGENGTLPGEMALHDGSGLSRLDMVSPETLARLLVFALQMKHADAFKNSLPIAGTDGTMRGRLANFAGKVLAKTGSITYVNSLAGYAKTPDETLAFVIFCNNETRKTDITPVIDELAAAIAGYQ